MPKYLWGHYIFHCLVLKTGICYFFIYSVYLSLVTSSKSKKRKSVTISAPIPCNTAFPSDNPAMSKLCMPDTLKHMDNHSDALSKSTGSTTSEISDSESNSFDSEPNTPKRLSLCSEGEGVKSEASADHTMTTTTEEMVHANGQKHSIQSLVSSERGEDEESAATSEDPYVPKDTQHTSTVAESEFKISLGDEDESVPVPAPRRSSTSKKTEGDENQNIGASKKVGEVDVVKDQKEDYENPPGFLYKVKHLLSKVCCHLCVFGYEFVAFVLGCSA